jgi:hypothetical protein
VISFLDEEEFFGEIFPFSFAVSTLDLKLLQQII